VQHKVGLYYLPITQDNVENCIRKRTNNMWPTIIVAIICLTVIIVVIVVILGKEL